MHKILFYKKFIICLYMLRALFAHHQEVKTVLYSKPTHYNSAHRMLRNELANLPQCNPIPDVQ